MRVLIIDDDRDVGEGLLLLLSAAGHQARWAPDRHAGLAQARREPPDAVLLDLQLADGPSLDLVAHLGTAPVFLITATRPAPALAAAAARSGAAALLSKSIEPADLLATIERVR